MTNDKDQVQTNKIDIIQDASLDNDADNIRILKNGAKYDMRTHRIVSNPGGGSTAITSQNASAYAKRRFELKRQRIIDSANEFVDKLDGKSPSSDDMRFINAIVNALMQKALNSTDPKQVDAIRFLMKESGLGEVNNVSASQISDSDSTTVLSKLGSKVVEYILARSKDP